MAVKVQPIPIVSALGSTVRMARADVKHLQEIKEYQPI
jgi:hypothetical protein